MATVDIFHTFDDAVMLFLRRAPYFAPSSGNEAVSERTFAAPFTSNFTPPPLFWRPLTRPAGTLGMTRQFGTGEHRLEIVSNATYIE